MTVGKTAFQLFTRVGCWSKKFLEEFGHKFMVNFSWNFLKTFATMAFHQQQMAAVQKENPVLVDDACSSQIGQINGISQQQTFHKILTFYGNSISYLCCKNICFFINIAQIFSPKFISCKLIKLYNLLYNVPNLEIIRVCWHAKRVTTSQASHVGHMAPFNGISYFGVKADGKRRYWHWHKHRGRSGELIMERRSRLVLNECSRLAGPRNE
jgi:hypothetical protein